MFSKVIRYRFKDSDYSLRFNHNYVEFIVHVESFKIKKKLEKSNKKTSKLEIENI